MSERLRVTTSDGKYTVIQDTSGARCQCSDGRLICYYHSADATEVILALARDLDAARTVVAPKHVDEHHVHVHMQPGQSLKMVGDILVVDVDGRSKQTEEHAVDPEPDTNDCIHLTRAEMQSGHDRVQYAENLIKQLPIKHDGRNTWLLNYGTSAPARSMRAQRNIKWNPRTRAAEPQS